MSENRGKYRWGCGRCGREFTNNDHRETACPGCGGYLFNPNGKTPITDVGTANTEREDSGKGRGYEVVIDTVKDKEHAELLRRRLIVDGFHEHAVHVRELNTGSDP